MIINVKNFDELNFIYNFLKLSKFHISDLDISFNLLHDLQFFMIGDLCELEKKIDILNKIKKDLLKNNLMSNEALLLCSYSRKEIEQISELLETIFKLNNIKIYVFI